MIKGAAGSRLAITLLLLCGTAWAKYRNSWNIEQLPDGNQYTMTISDPNHPVVPGLRIQIVASKLGEAQDGTVRFSNGVSRALTRGELGYYWQFYEGEHAIWDRLKNEGRVAAVEIPSGSIPHEFLGTKVRLVTNLGIWYIGKITDRSSDGEFKLTIGNSVISFQRSVVANMERLTVK